MLTALIAGFCASAALAAKPTPETHPEHFPSRYDSVIAALQTASCADDLTAFRALLSNPQTVKGQIEHQPLCIGDSKHPLNRTYFKAAAEVGCARVITSNDGRVRLWTTALEQIEPARRGSAFLVWQVEGETTYVYEDAKRQDLHWDTIIDGIYRLRPDRPWYLVVGLRAYMTKFAGAKPRRFAQVIELSAKNDGVRLLDKVVVEGKKRSTLLFAAAAPETGKFRHHVLAKSWLRYYPRNNELYLESLGVRDWGSGHPRHRASSPVRVATFDGERLIVSPDERIRSLLTVEW